MLAEETLVIFETIPSHLEKIRHSIKISKPNLYLCNFLG